MRSLVQAWILPRATFGDGQHGSEAGIGSLLMIYFRRSFFSGFKEVELNSFCTASHGVAKPSLCFWFRKTFIIRA